MNRIAALTHGERAAGVVAASTGNHGMAVAYCVKALGGRAVVYVPEGAAPGKIERIRRWGAEVRTHGADCAITEVHARKVAADEGMTYVSPYNDPLVIGGQGTLALELARQLERIDAVFVPLGGGGLISGIAGCLRREAPSAEIVGCSPINSQVMIQSIKAGRILDVPSIPTISDATAGGIEPRAITFDLCRKLVDSYVTVTELEIEEAMAEFSRVHEMPIEGAAGVALAAYLKTADRVPRRKVVVIVSGGNSDLGTVPESDR